MKTNLFGKFYGISNKQAATFMQNASEKVKSLD